MSRILYIQASPRGQRSESIKVADAFIAEYLQIHPQDSVEKLNVFDAYLPDFNGLAVQAKYTILHGREHTDNESKAWRNIERIIEQFKSADKYVLAVPMWNFNIPYRLKQYIDILVQPGYTFGYNQQAGYRGLVVGKPLLAVYARGGAYKVGSAAESFDLQKRYVDLIFRFIGFEDIREIIVEPTLQGGPDVADTVLEEAVKTAKRIAAAF
jgi:FMN-dependent NADH-azoreductase